MSGGLCGPPFIEARVGSKGDPRVTLKGRIGHYEAIVASTLQPDFLDRLRSQFRGRRLRASRRQCGKPFDYGTRIDDKPAMAKKPGTNPKGEFAFFNVVYEDDSQRSNRRVPAELLGGLDGDEPARGFIMEQDREIAEKSGRPALEIKRIERVGAKKK